MPRWPQLNMVTTPTPVSRALAMARSIAFGTRMTPRPRSQSMLAMAGRSRTTVHSGLGFVVPSA